MENERRGSQFWCGDWRGPCSGWLWTDWYQHQPSEPGAVSTSWRPSHTITLSVLPFWSHWHVRVCHTDHIHLSHPIGPLLSDPLLLAGVDHMMWRCWVLNSLTGCHWLVFCLLTVTDRIHQSRQSCRAWQSPSQYLLTQYFVMTDDSGDNWCLPWDMIQWFRCDEDTLL